MNSGTPISALDGDSASSSLLRGIKRHDQAAWSRLTRLFCPIVLDWVRRSGLQASDAADVVQEVFRSVSQSIDAFQLDHPGNSFRGWLWTISQNKIRDHFRQAARRPNALGGTDALKQWEQVPEGLSESTGNIPIPSDVAIRLMRQTLHCVEGDFAPSTWQAFWRSAIDGQPTDQIARDLGLSKQSVRQAKYRVLQRLRQELDGLLD